MFNLDPINHDRLQLLAKALNKTVPDTVAYLLDYYVGNNGAKPAPPETENPERIHVVYKGQRVEAEYDYPTQSVTITSGPLKGKPFAKPSPAARAVVELLAKEVSPHRNGWDFWTVTATGKPLQTLRPSK